MNPANRKLVQLTTDNFDVSLKLLKQLMGRLPQERKDFINNYESSNDEEGEIDE